MRRWIGMLSVTLFVSMLRASQAWLGFTLTCLLSVRREQHKGIKRHWMEPYNAIQT